MAILRCSTSKSKKEGFTLPNSKAKKKELDEQGQNLSRCPQRL